jgi:fumarate reductase flavoprotein subunit
MNWAHWSRVDALVVRAYLNKSGDTIRWLEEKGLEFELRQVYPNQIPVWHNPKGLGAQLMRVLTKNCADLGVTALLHTSGRRILRGAKGRVTGVVAVDREGREFEIKARSVIIATGGFGGNKELLRKYCPAYHDGMRLAAIPLAGDGLLMAAEAGAAIADSIPILGGGRGGPDVKMANILKTKGVGSLGAIAQEPYTIWVNKRGRRFADESALVGGNAGALQPEKTTYTIFDDQIRQYMEEKGIRVGMGSPRDVRAQRRSLPGLKEELQKKEKESKGKSVKNSRFLG